jgi:hypothetical protein
MTSTLGDFLRVGVTIISQASRLGNRDNIHLLFLQPHPTHHILDQRRPSMLAIMRVYASIRVIRV